MPSERYIFRTPEEALEHVESFLRQEGHGEHRWAAFEKLERIVKSEKALKRRVKRLEGQVKALRAAVREREGR